MSVEPDDRRLQAWTALATLFVDSERTLADYKSVAARLAQLGFAERQAEHMLRHEIAPVFAANLWTPAGEWTPWDASDVRRIMMAQTPRSLVGRLSHRIMVWLARRQADEIWAALAPLMACAQTLHRAVGDGMMSPS